MWLQHVEPHENKTATAVHVDNLMLIAMKGPNLGIAKLVLSFVRLKQLGKCRIVLKKLLSMCVASCSVAHIFFQDTVFTVCKL